MIVAAVKKNSNHSNNKFYPLDLVKPYSGNKVKAQVSSNSMNGTSRENKDDLNENSSAIEISANNIENMDVDLTQFYSRPDLCFVWDVLWRSSEIGA